MNAREERGLVIAATTKIGRREGFWTVPSQTGSGKLYDVDPTRSTCSCPDHQETGFKCKHQYAVEFTIKRELSADGTVTETKSITFTEKKTYKQNWPCYNRAQIQEKHRIQVLLHDLCRTIPEPPRKATGRPPVPIADRLFAVLYKVYSTISSRRFGCDLNDAVEKGYLSRTLHPNKVNCFMEDADLTPVLHDLVTRSCLPLQALETKFAVDSTGFSCARHVRWIDEKYGTTRSGRDWVKVHAIIGTKTNCFVAATILDRDAADCPQFPELVRRAAENFRIDEVSGDKAYLSLANVETVHHFGGVPFIAPKANTTGAVGGVGGLFERMIHYYRFNQTEYMNHYHQRSNAESAFSAVKRKLGSHIRSRSDVAMKSESLCKLICHNLTEVIQSQVELGIEATFWADAQTVQPVPVSVTVEPATNQPRFFGGCGA